MQVQKLSKFVDFTKACAESGLSKDLWRIWSAFAQECEREETDAGWFFQGENVRQKSRAGATAGCREDVFVRKRCTLAQRELGTRPCASGGAELCVRLWALDQASIYQVLSIK
jgi:hypothetical protein